MYNDHFHVIQKEDTGVSWNGIRDPFVVDIYSPYDCSPMDKSVDGTVGNHR